MASMTAAGCGLAGATSHCGRARPAYSASSSSSPSFSCFLGAAPYENRARAAPLVTRLESDYGFGSGRVALCNGGITRAAGRGSDNTDDAGVIKDMELFLDDLSLEYDSVWDTKPAWCQPWTIVGTGVGIIAVSWLPFQNAILTGGVSLVMGLWWYSFLYVYPLGYADMIAERRRRMKNGSEDTYGRKKD